MEKFKTYTQLENEAKAKSKVYKDIRYYHIKGGEVYFCNKKDIRCEYSFFRVCSDLNDQAIRAYIDASIEYLTNAADVETRSQMKSDYDNLKKQIEDLSAQMAVLNADHFSMFNQVIIK